MAEEQKVDKQFVNLAPISRVDKGCIYQSAFKFSIADENVFNIALTGPYGSGKSSIIKGLKNTIDNEDFYSDVTMLEVNLASFENKPKPKEAEIELSILQQMIYSTSSDVLPLSRFKRIKAPKNPSLNSLVALLTIVGILISVTFHKTLFSVATWSIEFILVWLLLTTTGFGCWSLIRYVYADIWSASIRKISFKNMEIEKDVSSDSILNKHVDEVLYFFERTKYNLVVFEDLDRFNTPDIYIKLREINYLINNSHNVGKQRKVKFLYALRDSVFTEKERTKFFDFIIPVVPLIGSSNSLDIINERVRKLTGLSKKIDNNFFTRCFRFLK
ncbi:YobI family P-loop NTPase [Aliiglaciecola lipolytica]|uniref:YobI-like P-loop NTPase domain-containing protein n=1 Tax=Aliiglaciecola lipolytica E3 TaxID=1127673 RepID=K6XUY8_9ALTE|nr:hypothetical protein [Aliiglaciecola lipolytica]GAC15486.1 hypothetical protein GLIP_2865 [Aliiglaciecola lipolytica E3]